VTLQQIQERKANGIQLDGFNDRRTLAETSEPVAKSGGRNLEVHGYFGQTVGGYFVEFVVAGGHCVDTYWTPTLL